jgi:hypothetical protein
LAKVASSVIAIQNETEQSKYLVLETSVIKLLDTLYKSLGGLTLDFLGIFYKPLDDTMYIKKKVIFTKHDTTI